MKKNFKYIMFLGVLFLLISSALIAQRRVIIEPLGFPPYGPDFKGADDLKRIIEGDSVNRKTSPDVTFVLRRNAVYFIGKTIRNNNFHLKLEAEEGPGPKPIIKVWNQEGGGYENSFNLWNNATFKNIRFYNGRLDGGYNNRSISIRAKNVRAVFDGVDVEFDRGALLSVEASGCTVDILNCKLGNSGHRKTVEGNGRLIDLRATPVDTLRIINNTTFNLTDRIIRNLSTEVKYFVYDHNTAFNTQGMHGALPLGFTRKGIITNNIFFNVLMYGANPDRATEQRHPGKLHHVITMERNDTINSDIVVRNNNITWTQDVLDFWSSLSTTFPKVKKPGEVTSFLNVKMAEKGVDTTKCWFREALNFKNISPSLLPFMQVYYSSIPTAQRVYPENWWVDSFYIDAINRYVPMGPYYRMDASYGTTAQSYTAADGGYPLGDLNWYPTRKADWLKSAAAEKQKQVEKSILMSNGYPNPFILNITFDYVISSPQKVEIGVYNLLNQKVRVLEDKVFPAGNYSITWDGKDSRGVEVPKGMYIVYIKGAGTEIAKKILKQ